jgi:hypothetical protein
VARVLFRGGDKQSSNVAPVVFRGGDKQSSNEARVVLRGGDKLSSNVAPIFFRGGDEQSSNETPIFFRRGDEQSSNETPIDFRGGDKRSSNAPIFFRRGNEQSSNETPVVFRGGDKQPSNEAPIIFRETFDTPLLFPNTNFFRNEHEGTTNSWSNDNGIEQRMLLPEGYSIPEEMFGSNYIWDTKGWPRLVDTASEPVANRATSSAKNGVHNESPIISEETPHIPLRFPNLKPTQGRHQNNYGNGFLDENLGSRFEMDGLEQRMLLPEGQKIPDKMYGPNYIWDTKGWPRFVGTVPQARKRAADASVKSGCREPGTICG